MASQRPIRDEAKPLPEAGKRAAPDLVPELDPDAPDDTASQSANETAVPPQPPRGPATGHLPPTNVPSATGKLPPKASAIRAPGWDNSGAMARDEIERKRAQTPPPQKPVNRARSAGTLEPVQTDSAGLLSPLMAESAGALTPMQVDSAGELAPVLEVRPPAPGQKKIEFSPDSGDVLLEVTAEPALDTADIDTSKHKTRSPSGFRAEPPPPEPEYEEASDTGSEFSDSGTSGTSRVDTVERALANMKLDEEEIPPSPEIAKRFDVILQLGKGGMAVVYLCRDPLQSGKIVAVKDIRTELKPGMRMAERVEHEVMLLKELDHPRIVKVYDLLKFGRGSAIIMEYIDGMPLDHEIGAGRRITWDFGVRILRDIGEALAYAHSRGVIHRDLKPDNILYSERHNVMKLVDFGLARLYGEEVDVSMTRTGMVVGTPHYMSPEQVSGKQLDQRSDVYSFGATLYYLITGQRHVEGSNIMDILEQQRSGEIVPPSYINRDMPDWLAYLIGKMMEIKAEDRYQGMNEVLSDLRIAEEDPVNFVHNNPRGVVKRFGTRPLMPYEPEPEAPLTETDEERKLKAKTAKLLEEEPGKAPASDKPTHRVYERIEENLPALDDEPSRVAPPLAVAQLLELSELVREVSTRLKSTEEKVDKQSVSALSLFLIVLLGSLIAAALIIGLLVYLQRTGEITLILN